MQQALSLLSGELNIGLELRDPLGRVLACTGVTGTSVVAEHLLGTADASLGVLTAHRDQDLDESGAQLLGAASGILALHLSRRPERYETEQRLHHQFLIDLLRPGTDRRELSVRASLLGLDLESPRAVCCVGIHVGPKAMLGRPPVLTRRALEVVEDAVGRHFPRSIVILYGAAAVILLPQTCPDRRVLLHGLRAALADATAMLNGMQLSAGLGAPYLSLDDYAGSYQDAVDLHNPDDSNREVVAHLCLQPVLLRRFVATASTQHAVVSLAANLAGTHSLAEVIDASAREAAELGRVDFAKAVDDALPPLGAADLSLTVVTMQGPIRLVDYLVTRCVEAVVHGSDLVEPVNPDGVAQAITAQALFEVLSPGSEPAARGA